MYGLIRALDSAARGTFPPICSCCSSFVSRSYLDSVAYARTLARLLFRLNCLCSYYCRALVIIYDSAVHELPGISDSSVRAQHKQGISLTRAPNLFALTTFIPPSCCALFFFWGFVTVIRHVLHHTFTASGANRMWLRRRRRPSSPGLHHGHQAAQLGAAFECRRRQLGRTGGRQRGQENQVFLLSIPAPSPVGRCRNKTVTPVRLFFFQCRMCRYTTIYGGRTN